MVKQYILTLLTFLLLAACTTTGSSQTITVFAAASLTDAFTEISTAYEQQNPSVDIVLNFAGSSTLAAQLIEGAPANVFASANNNQMQQVIDAGRINAEAVNLFAENRLTVIMPDNNPAEIHTLADLASPGLRLVVAAPDVPVRDYTETMLARMAASLDYGPAYRNAVLDNIVSEEENVRLVVVKVSLGEADAGIVYTSDVTPDSNVLTLPVPDQFNVTATYPIAWLTDDSRTQAFIHFVLCDEGPSILEEWGFSRAEGSDC